MNCNFTIVSASFFVSHSLFPKTLIMATPAYNTYTMDDAYASSFYPGQLKHADLSDYMLYNNGNAYTPYAYVYKDVSSLCSSEGHAGYGVFAARDIAKGTPVTFYAGQIYTEKHPHTKKHMKSDYVYEFSDGVHMVDGLWQDPNGPWWTRHGTGHLLNDNIHEHATGLKCNAYFAEVEMLNEHTQQRVKRVVIVTKQDVARGEELLVSYSLGYWLAQLETKNVEELGASSWQWLHNMQQLVQDFIDRMYAHGRKVSTSSDEDLLCQDLEMMTIDDAGGGPHIGADETYETLPFIGEVKCVDLYDNPKYCPTCEVYDFYFQTVVREGAFDLVFAFDNPHDMVCCDWQDGITDKHDASSDMDEDMEGGTCMARSKECRLTVHYIMDTFMDTWLHTEVSCWRCGHNIDHLSFVKN